MYEWITIQTHDKALDISRIGRIMAVSAVVGIVALVEYLMGGFTWLTLFSAFVGQCAVLKCWYDMIHKRQPDKNCWEFEA